MKGKQVPGKYNRIGSQKGPLNLGGALAKMEEEPDLYYVPHYHIVGNKKEVVEWIKENHKEDDVDDILSSSYCKENLENEELYESFQKEVVLAQKDREKVLDNRNQLRNMNLDFLSVFVQTYEEEQRKRPKGERDGNSHSKAVATLKQKVKGLKDEEKVLDITLMKKNGLNSKKHPNDKLGNRKRLAKSENVPFYNVVYNAANKNCADGVRNFLRLHGGFESDKITAIVDQVKAGSDINIGIAKSPTRSTLVSPTNRSHTRGRRNIDEELLE